MPRTNTSALLAAVLALALASGDSAHEVHDHGAETAVISVPAALRAEAATELNELVVVARSGELIIYLDRFPSNEPSPTLQSKLSPLSAALRRNHD